MVKRKQMKDQIQKSLNTELSGLRTSSLQRDILYQNAVSGYKVKRKLTVGWVFALTLMLLTVTAVAAVLLTHTEIVEQFAVPMAQQNDTEEATQETFSNEELTQIILILNENGITLDEDTRIMKALENGEGYWEEETLMAICREAFGGLFYEWSIEEKHWFDNMTVKIGFKEKNPYLIPTEEDMTIPEAKAYAAKLLQDEYDVELPQQSDDTWQMIEWFYAPWNDDSGTQPAQWKFEYIYRKTGETEYTVNFAKDGQVVKMSESSIHGEVSEVESFSMARQLIKNKHGGISEWPVEAWAEYGRLIAPLNAETEGEWCWQNAGYQTPPENAISEQEAIRIAMESIELEGNVLPQVICCKHNGMPIYKIRLSISFYGNAISADYDAIWCVEMDCVSGEVIDKREYHYAESDSMMMYVPFSVLDNVPTFEVSADNG